MEMQLIRFLSLSLAPVVILGILFYLYSKYKENKKKKNNL